VFRLVRRVPPLVLKLSTVRSLSSGIGVVFRSCFPEVTLFKLSRVDMSMAKKLTLAII
jgi:hypothetical protein